MKLNLRYILIFSILFTGTVSSHAGSIDKGYKALLIQDYFKAKKYFTKGLKYNYSAASQGLAIIYYKTDNPFHNYDSAYHYINKSIEGWDMVKQSKKDKWSKYGYTQDSLFSFRQSISTQFFKIANNSKSEEVLATFIVQHPWAKEKNQAIASRDSIAFFEAVKINDAGAYKKFADKYPTSRYAPLARDNFYDSQYYEETSDGSLDAYVNFIEANPDSPMKQLAEKSVFSIVTKPNTADSFNSFIDTYPQNTFVDSAWFSLYQYCLSNYSVEIMENFLKTDIPFKNRVLEDIKLFDSIALPFVSDSNYGFMNKNGEIMIPNNYNFAGFFQEGLAVVVLEDKYGFINKRGEIQIPCTYESASDYNQGNAVVELGGKKGMIDRNGRFLFDCEYDDLGVFSDGLVFASLDDKYGYYNTKGELIIPHLFDDAYDFHDGIAEVEMEDKKSFIDTAGNYKIPFVYSDVTQFHDTLYIFFEDGLYGIMNHKAQIFVEPIYASISPINNGLAVALLQNRIVYLNTLGVLVIDNGYEPYPNYLLKGEFFDGIAVVSKKGKYGKIDTQDKIVTKFEFDNIGLGKDQFPAQKGEFWGVYKSDGKAVVEPVYQSLVAVDQNHIIASKNDTIGVIDQKGNVVVPFSFEEIVLIKDNLFMVSQNDKFGIYANEKLLIPVQFDQIGIFNKDFLFLNRTGQLLYYNILEYKLIELKD